MGLENYMKSQGLEAVSEGSVDDLSGQDVAPQTDNNTVDAASSEVVDDSSTSNSETEVSQEQGVSNDEGSTFSFEDTFKDKYGKTPEELEQELSSLKEKSSKLDNFNPDSLDRLEKLVSGELTWDKIKEIAEVQTLDVDKLSDQEAIVRKMQMQDGLSKDEIDYKLDKYNKYSQEDFDDLSDSEKKEYKALKSEFSRLASDSKSFLNSLKESDDYKLPELSKKEEVDQEEFKKQFEAVKNQYESAVSDSLKDFNSISVNLGEEDFSFELTDEMKKQVQDLSNNVNNFHENFVGDKGVEFDKMFNTIAKGLFFDQAIKSAVESNKNSGKLEAVKDMNNITSKSGNSAPRSPQSNFLKAATELWKKNT
jgi:hypothetical protein